MKPNLLMAIILPLFPAYLQNTISSFAISDLAKNEKLLMNNENPYPEIGAIPLPEGYTRIQTEKKSFGEWLRNVPLKKSKTVYLYDGSIKKDQSAQYAVLNIAVGNKDLQQCADAVMRLRAEYLFTQKRFDEISFRDNNNRDYSFSLPADKPHFNKYLEKVFSYCGTISLEKQLHRISRVNNVHIGDVLIQGGSPGHAMLVIDMAMNKDKKKIYMLAQGYMPAQDIHIVVNQMAPQLSPWYEMNDETIYTPGWIFLPAHFRSW